MFHRLQTRLFLTLISVAVIALAIVALFAALATRRQFEAYVARDQIIYLNQTAQLFQRPLQVQALVQLDSLAAEVAQTYGIEATVYDAQGVIVAASDRAQVGQILTAVPLPPPVGLAVQLQSPDEQANTIHFSAVSVDGVAPGFFLFSATGDDLPTNDRYQIMEAPLPDTDPIPMFDSKYTKATTMPVGIAALPTTPPDFLVDATASQTVFWQWVNRAFLLAAVASILVAVLLSWVTTQRILRPVQALTAATRQMGEGDLSARVTVSGQDELAKLGQSFNQMANELTRQEELRRNLVTDVAHELLTPLTAVRGHLEAIQDGVLQPTPELIDSLHDEVMLLDELIAELQELSLAEAGQLHLDIQPVALADVVIGAVTAVTPQAIAKNLTLSTDIPDDLPLVEMDARRMGQVCRNLLSNAIKHTDPGGQITITARQQANELLISVQDTGEGIAPEHLPHIFDRFYRADQSRARATGGSGLGLAIVKGVVEAHNGRVWASSTVGQGSTFTLSLPLGEG